MDPRHDVVVPWHAGTYTFRTRWEAALFRWLMPRWTGWSAWSVISDDEKARALKPKQQRQTKRQTPKRKHNWTCMGGGGGWEVWECRRCGVSRIPSVFGTLWRPFDKCKRR